MRDAETIRHSIAQATAWQSGPARLFLNVGLLGLWLWLYRPVFDYLAIIFSREDFRTNQLILVGAVVLIGLQIRKGQLRPRLDAAPHLYLPALGLALGGSALFLVVERFLDINTLSASLFGLASYGLLGLWMQPRRWRQGMPAALLLIGALPFGDHMQTFIGYPARLLTAALVRDGLAAAGIGSVGIDTILVFENGVSQVDLPCSGVKSLWTGGLFLIAATWIERRPVNWRWAIVALAFAALLFVANLARVSILIVVGQVMGWRLAAQMLHVPLGVLSFVAACAAAVGLLRVQKPLAQATESVSASAAPPQPAALTPLLIMAVIVMVRLYAPRPHTGLAQPPPGWQFPAELKTQLMPLKPDEIDWLTRDGAESAERRRFEWRSSPAAPAAAGPKGAGGQRLTGSMILITSRTWRAHHRPERCFEVFGLRLEDSRTYLINHEFPLRFVSLGDGQQNSVLSAAYWFQSTRTTTDDYATRMWADLAPERDRWVLVSILFDGVYDPSAADVQNLILALHDAVARYLSEETLLKTTVVRK
jgi:exosortase O